MAIEDGVGLEVLVFGRSGVGCRDLGWGVDCDRVSLKACGGAKLEGGEVGDGSSGCSDAGARDGVGRVEQLRPWDTDADPSPDEPPHD
jgi:hypothetical protein